MTKKVLMIGGLVLATVACVGVIAGTVGGDGADQEVSKPIPAYDTSSESLMPISSGDEPALFSDRVSLVRDGQMTRQLGPGRITVWGDARGVCYRAVFPDLQTTGCADDATLRSGFSYSASQGPLGATYLFGLVPDEVAQIEIADQAVAVHDNLWFYEPKEGEDLSFRAVATDGTVTQWLGK
jgi:hypothetical protein